MSDEEYHGRELRRLEQKAARAATPAPAFDELAAFRAKLEARPTARAAKEVRDVFRGGSFESSSKRLEELAPGESYIRPLVEAAACYSAY